MRLGAVHAPPLARHCRLARQRSPLSPLSLRTSLARARTTNSNGASRLLLPPIAYCLLPDAFFYGNIPRSSYTFPMFSSAAMYAAVRISTPKRCRASCTRRAASTM